MEKVNTSIILDTRRKKLNGKYPIKLRITFQRKREYYPANYDLTKSEFKKVYAQKPRKDYRDIRDVLDIIDLKARNIIKDMPKFDWHTFEAKLLVKRADANSVYDAYNDYIQQFKKEDRLGTASIYECGLNSLRSFKEKLFFNDVTEIFLKQYECWMLSQDNSKTTLSIYVRGLRTIMNIALEKGIITKDQYPFGKRKYQIPAGRNIKKALIISDIGRIQNYTSQSYVENRAKDYWLFSYYSNGINFKDIALLKIKDVKGENIHYERSKTSITSRAHAQAISIVILSEIKAIIERQGNKSNEPEDYIFPILNNATDPISERKLIQQFIKTTNKYMKRIAKELKINLPITTYFARHSFATILKRSGTSVEFISESLGHSSINTTRNYLDSFESDAKKEIAQRLVPPSPDKQYNS